MLKVPLFRAHSRHGIWIHNKQTLTILLAMRGVRRMVEKLNDMIKRRYGKGLSIRHLTGVGQSFSLETSLRGEDLYIPIFVKDIFLGYGLVHEARDLSFDDQSQLTRLVRMILEPHLYTQHLERTLNNIEIEKSDLHSIRTASSPHSFFFYGAQAKIVQKVSLEIHEISENMAYLPFADVASRVGTLQDLESLENTTLVVDLEREVSQEQQNILSEFVKSSTIGPVIIFVASKASEHLSSEYSDTLKQQLKALEICADRLPLERGPLAEVLEMLYLKA